MNNLTHFNENLEAHMVDVSNKEISRRVAKASGYISMSTEALATVIEGSASKGDVLGIARIAAIQAAKQTGFLIPLCHPIALTHVRVDFQVEEEFNRIKAIVTASTDGKTGVEMEALTGVNIALLTIYDMLKAIDKSMTFTHIRLEEKSGGKNGAFTFSNLGENINF